MILRNRKKFFLLLVILVFTSCNIFSPDRLEDPNNPTVSSVLNNATKSQLQNLVAGLLARNRAATAGTTNQTLGGIEDILGSYAREVLPMFSSDPRNLGRIVGLDPDADAEHNPSFRGVGSLWTAPYLAVKQANILIKAAKNSTHITSQEKKGYIGFAQTIKAFNYIIPLMTQKHSNGIRINVKDPLHPGPFVPFKQALPKILKLLDTARNNLKQAGNKFDFTLTSGLDNFSTPATFINLNRAIYARLAIYGANWIQGLWDSALQAVKDAKPFFKLGTGKELMKKGAYFVFTGPPDNFNPLYWPRNANTHQIIMVDPSMISDIRDGDERMNKFFKRDKAITSQSISDKTITALYQGNRFSSNTSSYPWIRNEELILIYAEAQAHLGHFNKADKAINDIRVTWGLSGNFDSHNDISTFIDELLYERRYSLWGEYGQRWLDAKRYGRLDQLPKHGGQIWHYVARPLSEVNWNLTHKNK